MRQVYYKKLIRDKIPDIIAKHGGKYKTKVLIKREFERELRRKLLEESKELIKAPNVKLTDELSDILEIIKSLAKFHRIKFSDIEKKRVQKRNMRGGFLKRFYLIWSTKK